MTRPPQRLKDSIGVQRIGPKMATALLIKGLLPPDESGNFKPANLTAEAIVKMLHKANEVRNRTVTMGHVYKYSRDMTEGRWLWTGAPIQIDTDGFVRNGQHRLLAVVHSKTTQDFLVVEDVDPTAQLVMDIGRPRTTFNQMHLLGFPSASIQTAIANILLRWRTGKLMLSSHSPSVPEISVLLEAEQEQVIEALTWIYKFRRITTRSPLSALGAVFVEGSHVDMAARDEFFDKLLTGADLAVDDPILVLRNTVGRHLTHNVRGRQAGQLYRIVHAWNLWRSGETSRQIRIPNTLTSDSFPKMK